MTTENKNERINRDGDDSSSNDSPRKRRTRVGDLRRQPFDISQSTRDRNPYKSGSREESTPRSQEYEPREGYRGGQSQSRDSHQKTDKGYSGDRRDSNQGQGDRPQGGGYPRREGGYQGQGDRPQGGGYPRREGGYQGQGDRPQGGGYPRREGGYQGQGDRPQGGGYPRREGGYQGQGDRPQGGGYQRREGGNQGQGDRRSSGGYNQRREGGYQGQGDRPQGGGSQRREGGYQGQGDRRSSGGYQDRNRGGQGQRRVIKPVKYKENLAPDTEIRLNRYLSNGGVCSRREADAFIEQGLVKVNGEVVNLLGSKVLVSDLVTFRDKAISLESKVYVLLNKPKNTVTTSDDPQNRTTVMDLVEGACPERIYPVGRLDRNTTGVLLITNDGDLASKLMHPKYEKKKVYQVTLDRAVVIEDMQAIADGIELEDGEIHADSIAYFSEDDLNIVGIEIHSGRNRIVRRMFEHLNYRVVNLDRVYFAGLTKKNVRRGQWRYLTEKEVNMLRMGAFE